MLNYVIPDKCTLRDTNFKLLSLLKEKNWFIDELNIRNAYGILCPTPFAGGRITYQEEVLTESEMRYVLETYADYGVQYQFTFTNSQITEEMLSDYFGNLQLKLANEFKSAVLVYSDLLRDYIIEKYPNIHIVSSITKLLNLKDTIEELKDYRYKIVVINNALNMRLLEIPEEYRSKAEILVYSDCPPGCPNQKGCYKDISLMNCLKDNQMANTYCQNPANLEFLEKYREGIEPVDKFKELMKAHVSFLPETLYNLEKIGYDKFKFAGRESTPLDVALMYTVYCAKPEYQFDLFAALCYNIINE